MSGQGGLNLCALLIRGFYGGARVDDKGMEGV
jgi:hypothetical protein